MARFSYEILLRKLALATLITLLVSFLRLGNNLPLRLMNDFMTGFLYYYKAVDSDKQLVQWTTWALEKNRLDILPYLPKRTPAKFLHHTHIKSLTDLHNDILNSVMGSLFLTSAMMVMFLTTLWASFVEDKVYVLKEHLEIAHHPNNNISRERLDERYWKGVEGSRTFDGLATFLLVMRLLLCYYCTVVRREEAIYCLIRHVIRLLFICFDVPKKYQSLPIPVKVYFRYAQHGNAVAHLHWKRSILMKLTHFSFECLLAVFVSAIRDIGGVNDFSCAICDDRWPDVWTAVVPPDQTKLSDGQEEHCPHCWQDWAAGDITTVFRCGHVFHKGCNEGWFRMRGAQVCSMCTFPVRIREGQQAPKRKRLSEKEISRYQAERYRRENPLQVALYSKICVAPIEHVYAVIVVVELALYWLVRNYWDCQV